MCFGIRAGSHLYLTCPNWNENNKTEDTELFLKQSTVGEVRVFKLPTLRAFLFEQFSFAGQGLSFSMA